MQASMPPMRYFLIVYDRRRGELFGLPQEFEDDVLAREAYANTEREYRHDSNIEVVLIGADSLETVKQTHSNYFRSALSDYLAGV